MSTTQAPSSDRFMRGLTARNPGEPEFHQAARNLVEHIGVVLDRRREYVEHRILERLTEAERSIIFRVPWHDDSGQVQVNRGYRVQLSSALGPFRGGLHFHSTVNLGTFKALALENTLKSSLSTFPLGGAAGGSDFDPKGRSDGEVMRFCQSFMIELSRHVGPDTDVLSSGPGVGGREIGYLFGQHKRLTNAAAATFTEKGLRWGGTVLRPEAVGYGAACFADAMLRSRGDELAGQRVAVAGVGTIGRHAAEKSLELGARIVALSDASGCLVAESGINGDTWDRIVELTTLRRGKLVELADGAAKLDIGKRDGFWGVPCDVVLLCTPRARLDRREAESLLGAGCRCVCESSPATTSGAAVKLLVDNDALFGPSSAAGLGGVVLSGLERTQNLSRLAWNRERVDRHLQAAMGRIHDSCVASAERFDRHRDLAAGADIAAFVRVADAMLEQGLV